MSLRWDSPKEEWDRVVGAWNETPEDQRKERNSIWIQNILSVVAYVVILIIFVVGRT